MKELDNSVVTLETSEQGAGGSIPGKSLLRFDISVVLLVQNRVNGRAGNLPR